MGSFHSIGDVAKSLSGRCGVRGEPALLVRKVATEGPVFPRENRDIKKPLTSNKVTTGLV